MTASKIYEEKATSCLTELGLSVASERLDTACQQAAAESWSYSHFLGYLLSGETEERLHMLVKRQRKTVALNLQFAKFPVQKRLESFDFTAQPGIDRRLIDELSTGRFLYEGRNLVFLGPPGVGKTHLATALGVMACERGHRVYFTNALDMGRRLSLALEQNRLNREMVRLTHPKLLLHKCVDVILDEVGYLSLNKTQASLLFQAICSRYEKGQSIILTSNKAFSDYVHKPVNWGEVFAGDTVMASAALDRLLHRCTVVNIRGESYRLKEKRQAGAPKNTDMTDARAENPENKEVK